MYFVFLIIILLFIFFYILKSPVRGIYLTTFFLPFEYLGSYDFRGITVRPSQIFALMSLIALLIQKIRNKDFKILNKPLLIPLGFFLLANALAIFNAINFSRAAAVFLFIIFTIIFGASLPYFIKSKEEIKEIIKILLASTFIVSLFGLYQFASDMFDTTWWTGLRPQYTKEILGFTRIQSTALEPLYFANFLILPICLLITHLFEGAKRKWFEILVLFLASVNFILTVSRGAWLGLIFSLVIILFFYRKKFFQAKKLFYGTLIFIFLGFFVFMLLWGGLGEFLAHLESSFRAAAFNERVQTFGWAIDAWKTHPFFGIGPGNFGPWVYANDLIWQDGGFKIVNNLYLEILAESGIFGLLSFAIFLIMIFVKQIKLAMKVEGFKKMLAIGLLAAFIGVFLQYNTFSVIYIMHVWFLLGMMMTSFIFSEKV